MIELLSKSASASLVLLSSLTYCSCYLTPSTTSAFRTGPAAVAATGTVGQSVLRGGIVGAGNLPLWCSSGRRHAQRSDRSGDDRCRNLWSRRRHSGSRLGSSSAAVEVAVEQEEEEEGEEEGAGGIATTEATVPEGDIARAGATAGVELQAAEHRDDHFMGLALRHAAQAYTQGEVPIGAVLVDSEGSVLTAAGNAVEALQDATAHAEMLTMRKAASLQDNWRLTGTTLYTTLEPCVMCLAAAQQFRVKKVVFAAPDLRMGAAGSFVNLLDHEHPFHEISVRGGVMETQSASMMRRFFRSRRKGLISEKYKRKEVNPTAEGSGVEEGEEVDEDCSRERDGGRLPTHTEVEISEQERELPDYMAPGLCTRVPL